MRMTDFRSYFEFYFLLLCMPGDFNWILDIVSFTFFSAEYFCIYVNILELFSWDAVKLLRNGLYFQVLFLSCVGQGQRGVKMRVIISYTEEKFFSVISPQAQ